MRYFRNLIRAIFATDTILLKEIKLMTAALDRLTQEVSENNSAIDSAITLIQGLADEIRNKIDDSDALTALADSLDAKSQALAAAVAANTPATTPSDPTTPVDTGSDVPPTDETPAA